VTVDEPTPISAEDRATLVAYLDGELDEDAVRQVEARINQEPAIRAEVETLKRTWDMLDYLPRAEPSANFTHRTLAEVTAQRTASTQSKRRWRRLVLGVGWAAAVLLAIAAGFGAMNWLTPHDPTDEQLAHDLRVLENRKLYEQVDSIDFLHDLDQPELFGDEPESGG
jgi:anti-sigma factor RsiW